MMSTIAAVKAPHPSEMASRQAHCDRRRSWAKADVARVLITTSSCSGLLNIMNVKHKYNRIDIGNVRAGGCWSDKYKHVSMLLPQQ